MTHALVQRAETSCPPVSPPAATGCRRCAECSLKEGETSRALSQHGAEQCTQLWANSSAASSSCGNSENGKEWISFTGALLGKRMFINKDIPVVIHRAEDAWAGTEEEHKHHPSSQHKAAPAAGHPSRRHLCPSSLPTAKTFIGTHAVLGRSLLAEHTAHLLGKIPALLLTAWREQLGSHRCPGATHATTSPW